MILCEMRIKAQQSLLKLDSLGETIPASEEMLAYFKTPFATFLSRDMFNLIRKNIEELSKKTLEGKVTVLFQG